MEPCGRVGRADVGRLARLHPLWLPLDRSRVGEPGILGRALVGHGVDSILFGKYSGTDIKIDGKEVLILREDEVLAVLA